jgi:uncharacterized damage-inducible protein DinB
MVFMKIEKEIFEPMPNFPTEIGFYLSGMAEVREQLSDAVKDLSNEENSAKFTPNSHSIGQLILHIAEAEWWWIKCILAEKELDEEEAKRTAFWDVLLDEDFASKNYSAEFCIDAVDKVRADCLESLKDFSEEDLDRYFGWDKKDGRRIEVTFRYILHHLIDHEAQHKGQILMLKRLLREAK